MAVDIELIPADVVDGVTKANADFFNNTYETINQNFAALKAAVDGGETDPEWTIPEGATGAAINAKILERWEAGGGPVYFQADIVSTIEPIRGRPMLTHSGTAQSGSTSTTIKLATGAATNDSDYQQALVKITSGTGAGQVRVISSYVNGTKVATVRTAWTTTPDATSVYTVQYWPSAQWMVDLVGASVHGTKIVAAPGFTDSTFDGKSFVVRMEGAVNDRSGVVEKMTIDAAGHADYALYVAATVERAFEELNLQGAVISPLVVDAAQNLMFSKVRCMGGQYAKMEMNGAASIHYDRCEFTNATVDTGWWGADSTFRGYGWYPGVFYPLMNKHTTCLFEIPPTGQSQMVPLRINAGVGLTYDTCTFATSYTSGTQAEAVVVVGDGSGALPVHDISFRNCQAYRGGDPASGDYFVINDHAVNITIDDPLLTGGHASGNVGIRRKAGSEVTVRGFRALDTPKSIVDEASDLDGLTIVPLHHVGTTAQRLGGDGVRPPRYNTETERWEVSNGAGWQNLVTDADVGGTGETNLSRTLSATQVIVTSDTGTDATIPAADTTNAGVMTKAMFDKLAGVATGATANDTDANLKARANHTGSQSSSTISDFTEAVQDAIAAMMVEGTGVTFSYNDAAGTFTINSAGGGTVDAEAMQDAIGTAMSGIGNVTVTYNDTLNTITISTTATVNDTDANLKARGNHTGTQSADTVVDGTTNKVFTATMSSKLAAIEALADVTDIGNIGSSVHGAAAKTSIVDADELFLIDSAASNAGKRITWANFKAAIKSYYDTVASTLTNKAISFGTNTVTTTKAQLNTAITDGEAVFGSTNGTAASKTLWTGTQAQFDAVVTKDTATVYVVTA